MSVRAGRLCASCALLSLHLACTLLAQDQIAQIDPASLKRLSLEELSQIEVTSPAKEPQPAFRVPMAIYVITSEDIRRSGATSIPEVLRLAPGVEVARIEGSKWSVGIRGFGSRLARSVLVLIDGRTVYTTFFAGTYWEVQDTLLEDIDRIEIIRGPGGTIWGPNAVNGVINIITRHTRYTRGVLGSISSGDTAQGILRARYGGGNGRNLNYRGYAKAFTRGPQYHDNRGNYDDWRGAQTGFRIDWDRSDRETFLFEGDLYQQEAGQRVSLVNYTPPFSRVVEQNADLSGGNLNLRWKRKLRGGSDLQVQTYYDRTNRFEANFGETRDTGDIDFLVSHPALRRHRISWGGGLRVSSGTARQMITGLTFDPATRVDYLLTAFAQDEIELLPDRLSVTIGTKLLRTNFAVFEAEPSVRLMWTPTRNQAYWAAYTRAVRTPSRAERDFYLSGFIGTAPDGAPFFARFNANRDFRSEQLNGFEVGFRQLVRPDLYVDVAGFFNRYDDLFSQNLAGAPYLESSPGVPHLLLPAQFRNSLMGSTSGFEIAPEWRPWTWWRLQGAYSLLKVDVKAMKGSGEVGTPPLVEGSSPEHQVVIQSALEPTKSVEVDLTYRYVSGLRAIGIPAYSTGDARVAWRFRPGLEIALVGRNLFQPWHVEFANDPGPPVGIRRSAYLELTWRR